MTRKTAAHKALVVGRAAVGSLSWMAPDLTARTFDLPEHNRFVTQLFGSRDLTLAIAAADTSSRPLRRRALQLGVLVDTLDTIAGLARWRNGDLSTTAALLGAGGAAAFATLGLIALAAEMTPPQRTTTGATRASFRSIAQGWTQNPSSA